MTPQERANAYLALAAQLSGEYHDARALEWKIHLSVWTLLAGGGYVLLNAKPAISGVALVVILLLIVIVHAVWSIKMHVGERLQHKLSIQYRNIAEDLVRENAPRIGPDYPSKAETPQQLSEWFSSYWPWLVAELGTTVTIAVIVLVLATLPGPQNKSVDSTDQDGQLRDVRAELTRLRAEQEGLARPVEALRAELSQSQNLLSRKNEGLTTPQPRTKPRQADNGLRPTAR